MPSLKVQTQIIDWIIIKHIKWFSENIFQPLISFEGSSDFFEYTNYSYLPPPYNQEVTKEIFNSKIIAGINYHPVDDFSVGLLFSKYVKYENPFFTGYEREINTTPFTIHTGASYQYSAFTFSLFYQYSKIIFQNEGHPDLTESEMSRYLGVGIGYEL